LNSGNGVPWPLNRSIIIGMLEPDPCRGTRCAGIAPISKQVRNTCMIVLRLMPNAAWVGRRKVDVLGGSSLSMHVYISINRNRKHLRAPCPPHPSPSHLLFIRSSKCGLTDPPDHSIVRLTTNMVPPTTTRQYRTETAFWHLLPSLRQTRT
jgi:hypothetical protein